MADSRLPVRGVVLAGGRSQRFAGGWKALATVEGEPLVARVAGALEAATGRPPVVAARTARRAGAMADLLPEPAFVEDAPGFEGPLAGVVGAARAVREPYLFVAGCDMPFLSPDAVRWLAGHARRADAVTVVQSGVPQPTHALYRRAAVLTAVRRLPRDVGVQSLLAALPAVRRLPVSAGAGAGLPRSLTNVNTRAELRALEANRRETTANGRPPEVR